MDFFLTLIVAGMSVGAIYALVALGLNITFWTTRTLNFGQGALMMFCAMITAYLASTSISIGVAILTGLVVVAILGLVVERIAVRPSLTGVGTMGWVVATLGVGTVIQGVATHCSAHRRLLFRKWCSVFPTSSRLRVSSYLCSMFCCSSFP
jgi:branched-chain amino acid transport system permease protein